MSENLGNTPVEFKYGSNASIDKKLADIDNLRDQFDAILDELKESGDSENPSFTAERQARLNTLDGEIKRLEEEVSNERNEQSAELAPPSMQPAPENPPNLSE